MANFKKNEKNEKVEKVENIEKDVEDETVKEVLEKEEQPQKNLDANKEADELIVKLARLQADFVNYKKRSEKEKEGSIAYGVESFATQLLPIMDNFQRALDSEMDKESSFFKGVEMILNQLKDLLTKKGIEEIDDLGTGFDPNIHNAISMEESEEFQPGKVITVLQKGYKFKDKVIRPSMVIVSK